MKKKVITMLLLFCVLSAMIPTALMAGTESTIAEASSGRVVYSDVTETDWFYPYVSSLSERSIISGYPDGTFQPSNCVTCGEALKLILLAAGYEAQNETGSNWASGYVELAVSKGLIDSDDITDVDAPISRLLIAQLAANALNLSASSIKTPFSDTADKQVLSLYQYGIIQGSYENSKLVFKPSSSISRSEISAIVWRINNTDFDAPTIKYGSHILTVLKNVPVNTYDADCFETIDGLMCYNSEDLETHVGIDVSVYQGEIDWQKVKAAGIDFAIIRVGFRGYGTGSLNLDSRFECNIQGALDAGLEVGVYFFSQAITTAEAIEEADFVLSHVDGYNLTYPIVFDWESIGSASARTDDLDTETLSQCAAAFCSRIASAGYTPMVYFYTYLGYMNYDLSQVANYDFWLAQYSNTPSFYYHFKMWQYSSTGSVDGIAGNVDMNIWFSDD